MKKGPSHKKAAGLSRERKRESVGLRPIISSSSIGALSGLAALLILIFVFSALCLCFDDPHRLIAPLCFFAVISSSFFAGFAAQKRLKCKALIGGILCGCMLSLALWMLSGIIGLFMNVGAGTSYLLKILVIPSSCFGSLVGMPSSKKDKKRQFRR